MSTAETGVCYIREEFQIARNIDSDKICTEANNIIKRDCGDTQVSGDKIQKLNDNKKRFKNKGQNKHRPIFKEDKSLNLCRTRINGPNNLGECKYSNCKYVHDVEQYLKNRPQDIGETCYIYDIKGFCPRGITCRYSKKHLDENHNNLKADFYQENLPPTTFNGISSELQIRLRKFDYNFKETKQIADAFEKERNDRIKEEPETESKKIDHVEKSIGPIIEESYKKKLVDFRNKLVLSPLTTVGNLPFRRICKEYGADITCGEMACALPLVKGLSQEWALTKRHKSEDIFGVQVCGHKAFMISQAVQLIKENCTVDYVDLNIGCPIDLIYKQGGGSALMARQKVLEVTTKTCSNILNEIPFTVKTRTGIYADKNVAHTLIPKLEEWGASAITLHGRSREQRYTKSANWAYIEKCASQVKNIPVIGNGDILNFEDYNLKMKEAPHVSSVMIGRGALIKPWIFKEIKEQKHYDPSSTERFEMLQKYVNYGLEHWGSDVKGVENTRRFLLEWQSFLYRYVPLGLLKCPPQEINQRPEKYHGRDEMETLMSSGNCSDWIKLSEMLLGPVPDGFTFLPKHKANSYT